MHDIRISGSDLEDPTWMVSMPKFNVSTSSQATYVGIWRVHKVKPLASMAFISLQMAATWKIKRRSSSEKYWGAGAG